MTREEYAAFHAGNPMPAGLTEEQLLAAIAGVYGDRAGAVVVAARIGRVPTPPQALLGDLRSDDTFIQPNMDFAEAQLRHGAPTGARTFVYRFDGQSPNAALGACHCLDLPFLFGNLAVWLLQAVHRRLGIASLPEALCLKDIGTGDLVRVLGDWYPQPVTIYAIYPNNRTLTVAARQFLDLLALRFPDILSPSPVSGAR